MVKAFNRWPTDSIQVMDAGLKDYVNVDAKIVPNTGAKYAGNRFHKSKIFIVERLINKLMVSGHKGKKHKITSYMNSGKAYSCYKIVEEAFEQIEKRVNKNPVEVFVRALENAAPREEIITIEYGGARYPKAVEIAPQRRIDLALRYMVQGVYQRSFNQKRSAVQALVDEILNAYNSNSSSAAISKKNELERQSDSSR